MPAQYKMVRALETTHENLKKLSKERRQSIVVVLDEITKKEMI